MTVSNMKGLVIILDGLGDRPCPELDGLTPLEHAKTPVLDNIASKNQTGLMNPLLPGVPVDTHTGVSMIFGLPPGEACDLRRGPIEAAGINLKLEKGDLLFRANLATVSADESSTHRNYPILDRRAGRIHHGVADLCADLQNISLSGGITGSLFPATHHRCVLKLSGNNLSDKITDTDPGGKGIDLGVLNSTPADLDCDSSVQTAAALNEFTVKSHQVLSKHPINQIRAENGEPVANGVITRGVGKYQRYTNILHHLNLRVAVVAGEATIIGLGNLFDFKTLSKPSFTSGTDTNIKDKLDCAIDALKYHDLVYVHLKGTDVAAHDKDPLGKSEFIQKIDTALGNINLENLVLGICADHSTDSFRGEHNGDPVPILIHNPRGRSDLVEKFNETHCSIGAYGRLNAQGFITSVLDAMGCLSNFKPAEIEFYKLGH